MSSEWLTAESFERNHRLISAINTVSIHTKLTQAGITDIATDEEVEDARIQLRQFLSNMGTLVQDIRADQDAPLLGVDPRWGLLAQQLATPQRRRYGSLPIPLEEVSRLLDSHRPADQTKLIQSLRALRETIEQHSRADAVEIFGEL